MKKSITLPPLAGGASSWPLGRSLLLLLLAGLLVYGNNYRGEFFFDDLEAIVNNSELRSLTPIGQLLKPRDNSPLAARPVAAISFALNYFAGGLDVRGYHLANNLLHLLTGLALFGLVRATLLLPRCAPEYGARADGYGLAVALLWLVHPLNSEAVDYLVCRTELLAGLFYLGTMFFAAMAFKGERPRRWLAAAVVACGLGMGSKEVMVSAPLMVLLHDRLFGAGSFGAALSRRRGFYAALAATWLVLGFYQLDSPRSESVLFHSEFVSVFDYLRTQLTVIVHYLRLCFWPHPLVMDCQDWPIVRELSPILIWPLLLLGGLGLATVAGIRRGAWWSLLGAWFFAILAPTSSFIPIVSEIVAERRMYLPLAAVVAGVVFLGDRLWRWAAGRYLPGRPLARLIPLLILSGIAVVLGVTTFVRNRDYRSEISIWSETAKARPGNFRAHVNLAVALMNEQRWAEAVPSYREAIRLFDNYLPLAELAGIYSRLGVVLTHLGNFPEAVAMHGKAMELAPGDAMFPYHLGNTYIAARDLVNAAAAFSKALALKADLSAAHGNLGLVLMQQGDLAGAEGHFRKLIELLPQASDSYLLYADFLGRQGRFYEAEKIYRLGLSRGVKPEEVLVAGLSRLPGPGR